MLVIDAGPKLTNLIGVEYPNEKKISVSDLSKPGRLKRFLEENPDDIRIKGSKEFIVLSVVEVWSHDFWLNDVISEWREESRPESLINLMQSEMAKVSLLTTTTGKLLTLARYEQPSFDMLGAKFYFQRFLPDGRPLVTIEDKALIFKSLIGNQKVVAKFDLTKLKYQGKLEI